MISKVGERVAERGQLPVEHREYLWIGRMEHDVIHAVVAVDDGGFIALRNVFRQPLDQVFHRLDALGFGRAVLLGPAIDLAFDIVAGLAVVGKAYRRIVHRMQQGDYPIELVEVGAALFFPHLRQ